MTCAQCPNACSIKTPQDADEYTLESGLKLPKWFSFIFRSWKGVTLKDMKEHVVRTDYNPISPDFCPMTGYLEFCAVTGLGNVINRENAKPMADRKYVPMWPAVVDGSFALYEPIDVVSIKNMLQPALDSAFAELDPVPTPHSLRAVGLVWFLRCQVPAIRAKLAGRWLGKNAVNFDKYVRGGEVEAERYRRRQQIDPIFSFWCAKDNFVEYVN